MPRQSTPPGVSSARWSSMRKVLCAIQEWPTQHPSITHLAEKVKLNERYVQRLLREAETAGLVRISYSVGRGLANTYEVLVVPTKKVAQKGGLGHPLRIGTSYLSSLRRGTGQSSTDPPRRRPAVEEDNQPLEGQPWWMLRVGKPRPDEDWPRDAEGRRLALLEGKCFLCGQPLIRYSGGEVVPPRAVLVRFPSSTKDVPIHMAGGCPGSRPGQPIRTAGDIAKDRHLRAV